MTHLVLCALVAACRVGDDASESDASARHALPLRFRLRPHLAIRTLTPRAEGCEEDCPPAINHGGQHREEVGTNAVEHAYLLRVERPVATAYHGHALRGSTGEASRAFPVETARCGSSDAHQRPIAVEPQVLAMTPSRSPWAPVTDAW